MNKYKNGKIYKLTNTVDDLIYVGSTCKKLNLRFSGHKADSRRNPTAKAYQHLNRIGWDSVQIVLVEQFSCANQTELVKRERYWIDILSPSLNSYKSYVSDKEEKEYAKKYLTEYRKNNKSILSIKRTKPYHCDICDCEIRRVHKVRHIQSPKHAANLVRYMTNVIKMYREVKPIRIIHYSLK